MKSNSGRQPEDRVHASRWLWILGTGGLLCLLLFVFRPRHQDRSGRVGTALSNSATVPAARGGPATSAGHVRAKSISTPGRPAEEIVSEKVSQFARKQQEIVADMAKKLKISVPADMNRFFEAAQAGRWEDATNIFASLQKIRHDTGWERPTETLWHAVAETYGVAEQSHNWPAQKLLDYGNAILETLRPGMVYVGGTDAGRFIPALLTETGEGESHIVLTQNALADATYLDYLRLRYGDHLSALTPEDSQNGFTTYLQDAQKRLQHDQEFPNEPKQLRPGENIKVIDNRVQVEGQVAVMMINEQLVQKLLQKNSDLSFALEESTPLKSLYQGATTLGPVTELRADTANALTPEQAAGSLDFWQTTTQNLLTDPEAIGSSISRDAYAKLIVGQANLFHDRNLDAEAEQAFQMANRLSPSQPEALSGYMNLLLDQKRYEEARQVVQTGLNLAPDSKQLRELQAQVNQKEKGK